LLKLSVLIFVIWIGRAFSSESPSVGLRVNLLHCDTAQAGVVAPAGVVAEFDPSVVLTVHPTSADLNGEMLQDEDLTARLADIYSTRFRKQLYLRADKRISYARITEILDRVVTQTDRVVLLSTKSSEERLSHSRDYSCLY
jgi:biopolymer transport protein ExbD